jgi:tripartite-type tricarboxylate transporter receptor subunit TctC
MKISRGFLFSLVVAFSAGGPTDSIARIVSEAGIKVE